MDLFALNPINGKKIPVYAASYVVNEYAMAAIMGVPAHDARDWKFAQRYLDLKDIKPVLIPSDQTSILSRKTLIFPGVVKNLPILDLNNTVASDTVSKEYAGLSGLKVREKILNELLSKNLVKVTDHVRINPSHFNKTKG